MNAANKPQVIETSDVDGKRLRCTFCQQGGTFTHSIELIDGDTATTVLTSLDSHGEDVWPASPPWQELHVHQQTDGSSAFMLIGRAGSSHWSMSVTVDGNSLLFDVACRLRETPKFLGGTFRTLGADHLVRIAPVPIEEIATPVVKESKGQLVIDATNIGQAPVTVRWAYRIAQA